MIAAASEPEVAVIIVNWNGRQHIEQCLPALRAQTFREFSVILVDNGSSDGSVEWVRDQYPEVRLIPLERNRGFAQPNNLGIAAAFAAPQVHFVVTLNNDTRPEPDYLAELVACAGRHPKAGSIQPKVSNFFAPDTIDSTGILIAANLSAVNRGLKERDVGQFEREEEIFGASASAALYTRTALEQTALVGADGGPEYFDADYFAYYEDVDLALRLRLAGFDSYYTPAARVWHVHSATGKNYSPLKAFYIHRNQYLNMIKNLPLLPLAKALLLMPQLYWQSLLSVLRRHGAAGELARQSAGGEHPAQLVLRGWWQVLLLLPRMLRKRQQVQRSRLAGHREIASWFKRYRADFDRIVSG
ncbi:glycosyltransferase family 2 protein [Desulfuromonas carbonis]